MDPLNIATAADNAATLAYGAGDTIYELLQGFSEAGKEYETFSREVSQLGTCWVTLRRSLETTLCAPTEHLLRPLHRIIYDTNAILNDLKINLTQFRNGTERHEKAVRGGFLKLISSQEYEQRRRLQRFIRKRKISLQRSQLVYAKTVIDVVNAVIQYAQPQDTGRTPAHPISSEDSLIREANRARRRAKDRERAPENWPVTVTCWIHALPSGSDGHRSPFDILADYWTRPAPHAPPGGRFGGDQAQAIRNLEQRTAVLQQQVLDLNREVAQYKLASEEDHQTIARHQHTIAQLRAERETGRGRREESAQNATILRRLEGEVASLTRAYEVQGAEMRDLRQEYKRLDMEKKTATRDLIILQTALTRVEQERNEARKELEELKATLRPPNAFRWKAPKSRSDRMSGSSSSSRTYVDQSDSFNPGNSRSGSSRESSRDSRRGSFRGDREDGSRDGRRETPQDDRRETLRDGPRASFRNDRRESSREGRRGSVRDDRTESYKDRRESVRGDGREDLRFGQNERSRYRGEETPSESRGGSSRDSRDEYPTESRGGSSRDSHINYPLGGEEDDVRYYSRPGVGSQRRRWH